MDKQQEALEYIKNNLSEDQIKTYKALSALTSIIFDGAQNKEELVNCLFIRFNTLSKTSEIAVEISKKEILNQIKRDRIISYLINNDLIKEDKNIFSITGLGLIIGWKMYLKIFKSVEVSYEQIGVLLASIIKTLYSKKLETKGIFTIKEAQEIKQALIAMTEKPDITH